MHARNKHGCAMNAVLTINRGSSSLKFALYAAGERGAIDLLLSGTVQHIGQQNARLSATDRRSGQQSSEPIDSARTSNLPGYLIGWLEQHTLPADIQAIGHRVVHGGPRFHQPRRVADAKARAQKNPGVC
jgi:acetate kinase